MGFVVKLFNVFGYPRLHSTYIQVLVSVSFVNPRGIRSPMSVVRITLSQPDSFITFYLDNQAYALPLQTVVRVARAVEITRLPQSPPFLHGIINVQGQLVPVIDLRRAMQLPPRELQIEDRIILVNTGRQQVGIVVDAIGQVGGQQAEDVVTAAQEIIPSLKSTQGVFVQEGRLVLVQNLDSLLSLQDERALEGALAQFRENA